MKVKFVVVLMSLAFASGCATRAHCVGEQDYQHAYSLQQPALQGLKMPTSSAALAIPPPVKNMVPFSYRTTDGSKGEKNGMQCLDAPPKMVVTPNKS